MAIDKEEMLKQLQEMAKNPQIYQDSEFQRKGTHLIRHCRT